MSIAEINSLGKFLDESAGPGLAAQPGILDVLGASRTWTRRTRPIWTRGTSPRRPAGSAPDYFDHKRSLTQSITEVILEKAKDPKFGIPPEYTYG